MTTPERITQMSQAVADWETAFEKQVKLLKLPHRIDDNIKMEHFLVDYRTMYMGGGRQNYKSYFIGKMLGKYPGSICIFADAQIKRTFDIHVLGLGTPHYQNSRTYTWRDLKAMMNPNSHKIGVAREVLSNAPYIFIQGALKAPTMMRHLYPLLSKFVKSDVTLIVVN